MAGTIFGIHLLLPQVEDLSRFCSVLRSAQPGWLAVALVASVGTFATSATAFTGAVPAPLEFRRTLAVQVATSFTARIIPGVGRSGLSERYLRTAGVARPDAVAAIGLDMVAGFAVHMVFLVGILLAVRHVGIPTPRVPHRWPLLATAAAVVTMSGVVVGSRFGRRRVVEPVRRAIQRIRGTWRRPRALAMLLGGSAADTLLNVAALVASLDAFGAKTGTLNLAAIYLVGFAVASASPAPGGVGVMETAFVAGLTALGERAGPAVAGVLTFRLLTFWLPIVPGAVALRRLERRGAV